MVRPMNNFALSRMAPPDRVSNTDVGVRMSLGVRVHGDALDPARVTEALELQPTYAARSGEVLRTTRGGNKVLAPTGTWYRSWQLPTLGTFDVSTEERRFKRLGTDLPARLAGLPDVLVDFSILLAGDEGLVLNFVRKHAMRIAQAMYLLSHRATVEISLPTLGSSWTLPVGSKPTGILLLRSLDIIPYNMAPKP